MWGAEPTFIPSGCGSHFRCVEVGAWFGCIDGKMTVHRPSPCLHGSAPNADEYIMSESRPAHPRCRRQVDAAEQP